MTSAQSVGAHRKHRPWSSEEERAGPLLWELPSSGTAGESLGKIARSLSSGSNVLCHLLDEVDLQFLRPKNADKDIGDPRFSWALICQFEVKAVLRGKFVA